MRANIIMHKFTFLFRLVPDSDKTSTFQNLLYETSDYGFAGTYVDYFIMQ